MSNVYSYSSFQNVAKVGMRVRAVDGKYNECDQLSKTGSVARITAVRKGSFDINDCTHAFCSEAFLEVVSEPSKPWDALSVGDVVLSDRHLFRRKVLLLLGNGVTVVSARNNFNAAGSVMLVKHMKSLGWTIEGAEEKPKVTLTRKQAKTLNAIVTEECRYIDGKDNCPTCGKIRNRIDSLIE